MPMLDLGLMLPVREYKYLRKLRNQNLDLFQLTRYRANEKLEKENNITFISKGHERRVWNSLRGRPACFQ